MTHTRLIHPRFTTTRDRHPPGREVVVDGPLWRKYGVNECHSRFEQKKALLNKLVHVLRSFSYMRRTELCVHEEIISLNTIEEWKDTKIRLSVWDEMNNPRWPPNELIRFTYMNKRHIAQTP